MPLENHIVVDSWTEDDLDELPNGETDDYEYKSSKIYEGSHYRSELDHKITKAASAFWNTGGGILVVGVDDNGLVDGGIPYHIGKQKLRDWVDIVLSRLTPVGPYTVKTIKPEKEDSKINPGHVVLVIAFGESFDLPHMAPDNRYYVRTGAHSNPANHYIVEAIRARRGLRRPMLRALLRENPQKPGIVELVVLATNDLPALNVHVNFDPLPSHLLDQFPDRFPLLVPIIDRANPFRMDIATVRRLDYWLGDNPFDVVLSYEGVRGTNFDERQWIEPHRSVGPSDERLSNGNESTKEVLTRIQDQLERLNTHIEWLLSVQRDLTNR